MADANQNTETEQNLPVVEVGARAEEQTEFLRRLVKKGVLEVKPSLDKSGIHYVDAEEVLKGKSLAAVNAVLEDLTGKGLLKSRIVDRVLACPRCSSPEVHSKFTCPRCGFDGVELTELLEHAKCGYIGGRGEFVKGNELVCPRCTTALSAEAKNYRIIGNFYQCDSCGNRFDKPEVLHVCQNCGGSSTYQDVKYVKLFSYRISEDVIREFGRELPILDNMRKLLIDKGFRVKLHSKMTGVSGAQSPFDIIAERGEIRLVVDVSVEGKKDDIVAMLAKKVDVNPTKAVILDLSDIGELTLLGRIYDIMVFKAKGDQAAPEGFEGFLSGFESHRVAVKPSEGGSEG